MGLSCIYSCFEKYNRHIWIMKIRPCNQRASDIEGSMLVTVARHYEDEALAQGIGWRK